MNTQPREIAEPKGPRDQLDGIYEAERDRMAAEHKDVDACRRLWHTVIERAIDDIRFLRRFRGREELKKHEQERLRRICENPPSEFLRGHWFEQICGFLDVDPVSLRRAIERHEGIAA